MHKYYLKAFYEWTNKKKYDLQILQHNIRYINILIIQNIILLVKVERAKKKKIAINMPTIKVMQVCNATNIQLKYNWSLNYIDNKVNMNLRLQGVEKYKGRVVHIVDKFSNFQNFFLILIMFINKSWTNYDGRIQLDKYLKFMQNVNHKQIYTFFIQFYLFVQWWKIDSKDIAKMAKQNKEFIQYIFTWDSFNSCIQQNHIRL